MSHLHHTLSFCFDSNCKLLAVSNVEKLEIKMATTVKDLKFGELGSY
jgi:hypothetical protein